MKDIFTIALFCLILYPAYSQSYESIFGDNSTMWVFEWGNLFGTTQDTIFVEKDTFSNGAIWKKIQCGRCEQFYVGGLLREDTLTGKVYYKALYDWANPFMDTTEQLAFDFSLVEGDTFNLFNVWGDPPDTLEVVDTTYLNGGRKFIEFKMKNSGSGEPYTFIEGVGGNLGIIYKHYMGFLQEHYLLCSFKDGIQTYFNKKYGGNCDIYSGTGTTVPNSQIRLYPNPSKKFIYIDFDAMPDSKFRIYDSTGQAILSGVASKFIDIKDLTPGIYFFTLQNPKIIFSTTFIKI